MTPGTPHPAPMKQLKPVAGLGRTGVTERIGTWLLRISGGSESWLIVALMAAGAILSLVMNNIAAASVLLPGRFHGRPQIERHALPLAEWCSASARCFAALTTDTLAVGLQFP